MSKEIIDTRVNGVSISKGDIEKVCGEYCDDSCEALIMSNYDIVIEDEAWAIIDVLWDIYGRG